MKHPAITSTAFRLVETFELDVTLGDDSFPLRVELFGAADRSDLFRCRVWRGEHHRIQPTFPQRGGRPAHEPSDELILVDCTGDLRSAWDPAGFEADSPDAARRLIEEALSAFLDHVSDALSS